MNVSARLGCGFLAAVLAASCAVDPRPPSPQSGAVETRVSDGKIAASLLLVLNNPDQMKQLQNDPAARRRLPFVVEEAAGGGMVVPVFIETKDAGRTVIAVRAAGGTTSSSAGTHLIARIPIEKIKGVAANDEVVRIEGSGMATMNR